MRLYNFDDVVGNGSTVAVLRQSIMNGTFPQISIFSGIYGTGKSTCAEIVGLALTCAAPLNGNPCLTCQECINTVKALQTTAASNRVIKINVGQKNTKADVDEMIKDIFILKSSESRIVYIIEEAHSLAESQQTALLEELDKIPKGVYVIFVTTRITKLLPELRSRAINFNFNRINDSEAEILLNKLSSKKSFTLSNEVKSIIIGHSRGIPRQLTSLFEFIANGDYKEKTLAEFLGIISESEFISLFEIMKSGDMFSYVNMVNQISKNFSLDVYIEQLKDFILKVVFLLEGDIQDGFYVSEIARINEIFSGLDIMRLAGIISAINNNCSEADFKFALLKLRQALQNKTVGDIVKNNALNAVSQTNKARALAKETDEIKKVVQNDKSLTQLDIRFLDQFGG